MITIIVVDGTWSKAKSCVRRIKCLCKENDIVMPPCVSLNISHEPEAILNINNHNFDNDIYDHSKLEKHGHSISVMRRQSQPGRITTGEAVWMMLRELGQPKPDLDNFLEAFKVRCAIFYIVAASQRPTELETKTTYNILQKHDLLVQEYYDNNNRNDDSSKNDGN